MPHALEVQNARYIPVQLTDATPAVVQPELHAVQLVLLAGPPAENVPLPHGSQSIPAYPGKHSASKQFSKQRKSL
jgi:hypothetical protein